MFPLETNEESPLKSMTPLVDSPVHGVLICVTKDTTMWKIWDSEIGKPHSYYLAKFDPITSVGVIFLGTSTPVRKHRFVGIHGGHEPAFGTLTTTPPAAFNEIFYLNLSHPLRVELIYHPKPTNLNTLKTSQCDLDGQGGPPEVGITTIASTVPRLLISLDAISTDTFWKLYKAYHVVQRRRRSSLGQVGFLGGSVGDEGGPAVVAAGARLTSGTGLAEDVGGGPRLVWGSVGGPGLVEGATEDAPWGKIGHLRIGIDLCCIIDDFSDEEGDEESVDEGWELGQKPFGLDGRLVVSDFPTSTFVQSASVMETC